MESLDNVDLAAQRPLISDPASVAETLMRLSPDYATTALRDMKGLAQALGIARLLVKDETTRALGSFKSLGGTYAGLRAISRALNVSLAGLLGERHKGAAIPRLVCASDGNHGLAVAAAAGFVDGTSTVFLHTGVSDMRARRIEAAGAKIVWIKGTYDDAVAAARNECAGGDGILVPDTSEDPLDPVVLDVMAGYAVIPWEIKRQFAAMETPPTHMFVQAGVGGLAAAMADGLASWLSPPGVIIVVEPEAAACVSAALQARKAHRISGDLDTAAEMLSCGEASASALASLWKHSALSITVSEKTLMEAPFAIERSGGPLTTASGAAGFAGLQAGLLNQDTRRQLQLDKTSEVLIFVTEGQSFNTGSQKLGNAAETAGA